jgi:hypothetical protein
MPKFPLAIAALGAVASALPNVERKIGNKHDPRCRLDQCLVEVVAADVLGGPVLALHDCQSFLKTTVTPAVVIRTATATAFPAPRTTTITSVLSGTSTRHETDYQFFTLTESVSGVFTQFDTVTVEQTSHITATVTTDVYVTLTQEADTTITNAVVQTDETTLYSTEIDSTTITELDTPTATVTETDYSTETEMVTISATTTLASDGPSGESPQKRSVDTTCTTSLKTVSRPAASTPSSTAKASTPIPRYANRCANTAQYISACRCIFATSATVIAPAPTTTTTLTVTHSPSLVIHTATVSAPEAFVTLTNTIASTISKQVTVLATSDQTTTTVHTVSQTDIDSITETLTATQVVSSTEIDSATNTVEVTVTLPTTITQTAVETIVSSTTETDTLTLPTTTVATETDYTTVTPTYSITSSSSSSAPSCTPPPAGCTMPKFTIQSTNGTWSGKSVWLPPLAANRLPKLQFLFQAPNAYTANFTIDATGALYSTTYNTQIKYLAPTTGVAEPVVLTYASTAYAPFQVQLGCDGQCPDLTVGSTGPLVPVTAPYTTGWDVCNGVLTAIAPGWNMGFCNSNDIENIIYVVTA